MTRRIRHFIALLAVAFAFASAACADTSASSITGPQAKPCDHNGPWTSC
jgi:curli biogenesis system outer membrane secretion channel CsgG